MMMGRVKPNEGVIKGCILAICTFAALNFLSQHWNPSNIHTSGRLNQRNIYAVSDQRPYTDYKKDVIVKTKTVKHPADTDQKAEVTDKRIADVDFRIIIITFKRAHSLLRLLTSLNDVDYLGDKVALEVWIDRPKSGSIDDLTYGVAKNFKFTKGHKSVHNQTKHAGLYGQWIWTWQPKPDTKEICVILEDDLSVSKFLYRYLKKVHEKYDSYPKVNGYALQGVSMKHGGGKGNLHAPDDKIVFLYPVLGSWGFSPNAKNWIEFQDWFTEAHKNKTFMPLVPGILPSVWYKKEYKMGKHENIWTMWHIFYAYMKQERTLYPNYTGKRGFTINWRENGLHFSKALTVADPIVNEWDDRIDKLPDDPVELDVHGVVKTK